MRPSTGIWKTKKRKKRYLLIKNGSVIRTTWAAKEFQDKERYKDSLIYEGEGYKIYDYHKNQAMPMVKMLLETFTWPSDLWTYVTCIFCLITVILCGVNYYRAWKIVKSNNLLQNTVVSNIEKVKTSVDSTKNEVQKVTEQKNVAQDIINQEKQKTLDDKPIKEAKTVELENKITILEQNNRALELEAEKMRLLANNKEPDKLALYEQIKKEFYETEKERIKKEVELEYITGEKTMSGLLDYVDEAQIRAKIQKEEEKKYKEKFETELKIYAEKIKNMWISKLCPKN